jgi:nitrogen fixation protein NifZ
MSGMADARPKVISKAISKPHPKAIARVVYDGRQRVAARSYEPRGSGRFEPGDEIRSLTLITNDGSYPHKDIGEVLVRSGDAGIVRESWCFLGEVYYTVEFMAPVAFVIMRGREMARIVPSATAA